MARATGNARRKRLGPSAATWVVAALAAGTAISPARADPPGTVLAERIAEASGLNRWGAVEALRFTWEHAPNSVARSYDWRPREGRVTVRTGASSHTVPSNPPEGWSPTEGERSAHEAFVNDSYWLLFPLYLQWSRPAGLRDLGARSVPRLTALGSLRALEVTYGPAGGYTPGDRYVLYVGEDFVPRAWAYHRDGAAEPTLVTTREANAAVRGLIVPTEFRDAAGALFIRITGLEVR